MAKKVTAKVAGPAKDQLSLGGVVETRGIASFITLLLNAAPLLKELVALIKELLATLKAAEAKRSTK